MIVTFNFSSIVQSSNNLNILPKDTISGSVFYDPTQFGNNGLYTFTGSSKIHTFNWKAFHNELQITIDAFIGRDAFYKIIMSHGNNITLMEIIGATITGYRFELTLSNPNDIGLGLPTTMNNFDLNNGVSNIL